MRALALFGLTLAVLGIHLFGWWIAASGRPQFAVARAGIRRMEIVSARGRLAQDGPAAPMSGLAGPLAVPPPATSAQAAGPAIVARRPTPAAVPLPQAAPARANARTPATAAPGPVAPYRTPPAARAPASRLPALAAAQRSKATSRLAARARPQAGRGGEAESSPPDAPAWPVYPTHPPPPATLRYVLVQAGGHGRASASIEPTGEAELEWSRDASSFSLRIAVTTPGRGLREWQSVGGFDAAGLAPLRLAERDKGRDRRAINFDRETGHVRFSGASQVLPVAPGAQDRWSWVAQLAAVAEGANVGRAPTAQPGARAPPPRGARAGAGAETAASIGSRPARRAPPGTTWEFQVAGLRGELDRWIFRVQSDTELPPEAQQRSRAASAPATPASRLLHVVREPERPYDLRVEAWLSPAEHHLPIGLRLSAPPGSWSFALWPRQAGDGPASGVAPAHGRASHPELDAAGGS